MERPQEAGRGLAPDTPSAPTPVQEDPDPEAGPGGQRGRYRVPQPPLPGLHAPIESGHHHPVLSRLRPRHQLLRVDVMSASSIISCYVTCYLIELRGLMNNANLGSMNLESWQLLREEGEGFKPHKYR